MPEKHLVTDRHIVHARGCSALAKAKKATRWDPSIRHQLDRRCQVCWPAVPIR